MELLEKTEIKDTTIEINRTVIKYQLVDRVMQVSKSSNWDDMKKEWAVDKIYYIPEEEEMETCLCGHYPIREVIILKNKVTEHKIKIGNCCVNKFFDNPDANKVFAALKKGKKNRMMIDILYEKNLLNEREFNFLCDVWRKRKMSEKQRHWYESLKIGILNHFKTKLIEVS
jgi:hypothetical protein